MPQTPSQVPFNKLPKRKRGFIKDYVRLNDLKRAYLEQGYADSSSAMANARKLRIELASYIDEELGKYVTGTDMAILAVSTIKNIAETSDSDVTKLAAAKELLTRGGWDAPKETVHTHINKQLTDKQLDERILEISNRLGKSPMKLVSSQ